MSYSTINFESVPKLLFIAFVRNFQNGNIIKLAPLFKRVLLEFFIHYLYEWRDVGS